MSTRDKTGSGAEAEIVVPRLVYFTKVAHHETYERISPLKPELSVRGKNVVVTGGGTGIGKSIAISFAQAGAKSVSILGRKEDILKDAVDEMKDVAPSNVSTFQYAVCDLVDRGQVDEALDTIIKTVGRIDILVSNAGYLPDLGPIASSDTGNFMYGFEMNVLTTLNAVQAFMTRAGPEPMIINVSSCIAHMKPVPSISGYTVSKAANLKLVDCIAAENPHLHVVNLQPGTVATNMQAKAGVPAKDQIELPGNFCVWLASEEAKFLKSKFVWANWDVDELIARKDEIVGSSLFTWGLDGVPL